MCVFMLTFSCVQLKKKKTNTHYNNVDTIFVCYALLHRVFCYFVLSPSTQVYPLPHAIFLSFQNQTIQWPFDLLQTHAYWSVDYQTSESRNLHTFVLMSCVSMQNIFAQNKIHQPNIAVVHFKIGSFLYSPSNACYPAKEVAADSIRKLLRIIPFHADLLTWTTLLHPYF